MSAEIRYNGSAIATVEPGTTKILECAGKKMKTNVAVEVSEDPQPILQEKAITVSGNGTIEILPDDGFDGLSKIVITVEGGSGGSESNFTQADGAVLMTSEGKVFEVKEN